MSLEDFVNRMEQGDRLIQPEDYTGVRGKTVFDRLSSNELRDLYAEGNPGADMISVDVPSETMRRMPLDIPSSDRSELLKIVMASSPIDQEPYGLSGSRWQRTQQEREARGKGYVLGHRSPGRLARHAFESKPSRVAYQRPDLAHSPFTSGDRPLGASSQASPTGVVRGNPDDIHMNIMARYEPSLQGHVEGPGFRGRIGPIQEDEKKFWRAFAELPDEALDDWEETAGFVGRGGEFTPRSEAMAGRGESFILRDKELREGAAETKAVARADSQWERDQVRRNVQARRVQNTLGSLREERLALEGTGNAARVQKLTRAIGKLKNFAIRRGLMGFSLATIGSSETVQEALGFNAGERAAEEAYGLE